MTASRAAALALAALAALAAGPRSAAAAPPDGDAKPPAGAPAPPPDAKPAAPELKIEVIAKGEGRAAKKGDIVLAHVVATLAQTGAVLMDTHLEEEPQPFPVGGGTFVPALDQVLERMRVGDHWKVTAPYQLAEGERGYPPAGVPKKSDIVYDVEVVGFVDLAVQVLAEGSGATPAPAEYVLIHYTGTMKDGGEFDDTRKKDAPLLVAMGAGQVIPGVEIALRRMRPGGRIKVAIPWQLAYGPRGKRGSVPPKTDVVFDIERLPLPEIRTEVVAAGMGPLCRPGQRISVHFTGTFADGKQFDTSRTPGHPPADVVLGARQVLAGWDLTLAKMHVGDRWKIRVPWQLAYGADGDKAKGVPPRADLDFDIEVVGAK
jgi:peptidylprolyl isomerase